MQNEQNHIMQEFQKKFMDQEKKVKAMEAQLLEVKDLIVHYEENY